MTPRGRAIAASLVSPGAPSFLGRNRDTRTRIGDWRSPVAGKAGLASRRPTTKCGVTAPLRPHCGIQLLYGGDDGVRVIHSAILRLVATYRNRSPIRGQRRCLAARRRGKNGGKGESERGATTISLGNTQGSIPPTSTKLHH